MPFDDKGRLHWKCFTLQLLFQRTSQSEASIKETCELGYLNVTYHSTNLANIIQIQQLKKQNDYANSRSGSAIGATRVHV